MIIRRIEYNDMSACLKIVKTNWSVKAAERAYVEIGQAFGFDVWRPIFYVAVKDGDVIGFGGYSASWIHYGIYDLTLLHVDPNHQKQGIGKMLVDIRINDIRSIGKLIMLSTTSPNYYTKHWGFVHCFNYENESIMKLEL